MNEKANFSRRQQIQKSTLNKVLCTKIMIKSLLKLEKDVVHFHSASLPTAFIYSVNNL
jgi:hypothetical protein